jgi:CRISPR-associated protein Cas5t
MLYLYVQAPFAACRTFTAGWYRPTATFLTPSAAYGLILNVAGIESRLREEEEGHDGKVPASLTRPGLPAVRLALGAPVTDKGDPYPRVHTVYQQLHNYMVGGKEKVDDPENLGQKVTKKSLGLRRSKHSKWNITPVRREFLSDLRAVIALNGNTDLEDRVCRGLRGEFNSGRYGLPFLGDNAFLLDRLELLSSAPEAHWYERVSEASGSGPRPRTTRLTILIDRAELSRTTSALFAPLKDATCTVPEPAWTEIRPPAELPSKR